MLNNSHEFRSSQTRVWDEVAERSREAGGEGNIGNTISSRLTRLISIDNVVVRPTDNWMPKGFDNCMESLLIRKQDGRMLTDGKKRSLHEWWLQALSFKVLNWDLVSTCSIRGEDGLLLVEAKTHENELNGPPCGAQEPNLTSIANAIRETNSGLREATGFGWNLSHEHHYQLSNRFAWAWKLTELGYPVMGLDSKCAVRHGCGRICGIQSPSRRGYNNG